MNMQVLTSTYAWYALSYKFVYIYTYVYMYMVVAMVYA